MATQLVNLVKLPNGDLRIELLENVQEELQEITANEKLTDDQKLIEVLEYQLCNGWDIVDYTQIALCPDTLIISDEMGYDNDGMLEGDGTFYFDNYYAIRSAFEALVRDGYVVFTSAE